ncbi:MAG: 3-methyl-2-oxobutanoate hydroxymethyltransferase [Thermodesulfobacteriota bacterium]
MKKITICDIVKMKGEGRKIPVLTAYGYSMARIVDDAGIPVILVGDSVGMVEGGHETTLPVTVEEMIYHTRAVVRGRRRALVVTDMPFLSYQVSLDEARRSAGRLIKEGGAEAVKLEGGVRVADAIRAIVDMDIPVMGHVGLTPQSIHRMGGYRVQGRGEGEGAAVVNDARAVKEAGAFAVVLEGIPAELAEEITGAVSIPTIGIGAGPDCDGQVLVIHDLLGLTPDMTPPFVKRYADLATMIASAVKEYRDDVEEGRFPGGSSTKGRVGRGVIAS